MDPDPKAKDVDDGGDFVVWWCNSLPFLYQPPV